MLVHEEFLTNSIKVDPGKVWHSPSHQRLLQFFKVKKVEAESAKS